MDTSRFEPRQWCLAPSMFGKSDSITWIRPQSKASAGRFAAAYMQHAYCWAIRKHAIEQVGSVKGYAAKAELPYDRLARVLRGQAPLRFEDVGVARTHLGDIHETARLTMDGPRSFAPEPK